jgi:glycine/D-amino acid oxidase-like deaminating enzyme
MKYIIVGQGVAGTLMAFEMERRGVDFHIIDSGKNHSSSVAAGIMNPVVFRRLTKSWRVDECWKIAIDNYRRLEAQLDTRFFHTKPMRRLFASEQEAGFWEEKTQRADFSTYISKFPENDTCPTYAINNFGCGLVNEVHHMDVQAFLECTRNYFTSKNKITTAEVDYFALQSDLDAGKITGVIYCQGYQNFENPLFKKLPVQTTKGQILTVQIAGVSENELLNRKCFILPLGDQKYRVGATYEWENTTLNTTEEARNEISEKLRSLIHVPFEVVEQDAGIRPTTPDRRPILGEHPEEKNHFILNGLGTKGYLLAPWCVEHLSDHIFNKTALLSEVDLTRFIKE